MMDPCHGSGSRVHFGCDREPGTAFSFERGREFESRQAHHFFSTIQGLLTQIGPMYDVRPFAPTTRIV